MILLTNYNFIVVIPRSGQLKDGTTWDAYKLKNVSKIEIIRNNNDN